MNIATPISRFFFVLWSTSVLFQFAAFGQSLENKSESLQTLSDEFYYGGIASVGTCFFGPNSNDFLGLPFLAKGGLTLTRSYFFFEASASFLNGRQKGDFQLYGQNYLKGDRYSMVGAQALLGYWIPVSENYMVLPTVGLSYLYFMPGNKELSDSKTIYNGPVGCPTFSLFLGKKLRSRKEDFDSPHIEIPGIRYEVIWTGIGIISEPIHQVSFSIIGLLSNL